MNRSLYKKACRNLSNRAREKVYAYATRSLMNEIKRNTEELNKYGLGNLEICIFKNTTYNYADNNKQYIEFAVEQCPGWYFGLWWDDLPVVDHDGVVDLRGVVFAQYIDTIDKFKPSCSNYKYEVSIFDSIYVEDEGPSVNGDSDVLHLFAFIANYPNLAFCKDYYGYDYNIIHLTEEEATAKFQSYTAKRELEKKVAVENDTKLRKWVGENITPLFHDIKISDDGENCSPRYTIFALLSKNKDDGYFNTGCYSWIEEDDEEERKKVVKDFSDTVKECTSTADQSEVVWWPSVDAFVVMLSDKKYKKVSNVVDHYFEDNNKIIREDN